LGRGCYLCYQHSPLQPRLRLPTENLSDLLPPRVCRCGAREDGLPDFALLPVLDVPNFSDDDSARLFLFCSYHPSCCRSRSCMQVSPSDPFPVALFLQFFFPPARPPPIGKIFQSVDADGRSRPQSYLRYIIRQ